MKSNIKFIWGIVATFTVVGTGSAHALVSQNLPEPTTMSLIGAGIAGVVVAARLRGRK